MFGFEVRWSKLNWDKSWIAKNGLFPKYKGPPQRCLPQAGEGTFWVALPTSEQPYARHLRRGPSRGGDLRLSPRVCSHRSERCPWLVRPVRVGARRVKRFVVPCDLTLVCVDQKSVNNIKLDRPPTAASNVVESRALTSLAPEVAKEQWPRSSAVGGYPESLPLLVPRRRIQPTRAEHACGGT
jgi:hypothetical protein